MILSVDKEVIKAAYIALVKQRNQLFVLGKSTSDGISTILLLEGLLINHGEYSLVQEMQNKMNNPYAS